MAKGKRRVPGAAPPAASFDAGECRRVVQEFQRQRKNASEYAGAAGGVMKSGSERLGIERRALNLAATMDARDPGKRTAFMRDYLRAAHALGHFDQVDAFDDLLGLLETIVDDCRTRETPAAPEAAAENLKAVLN